MVKMLQDIGHERLDACGTDAARLHNGRAVTGRTDYGCDEIVHVRDDKPLQFWGVQRRSVCNNVRVTDEQVESLAAVTHKPDWRLGIDLAASVAMAGRGTRNPMKRTGVARVMVKPLQPRGANIASPSSKLSRGRFAGPSCARAD